MYIGHMCTSYIGHMCTSYIGHMCTSYIGHMCTSYIGCIEDSKLIGYRVATLKVNKCIMRIIFSCTLWFNFPLFLFQILIVIQTS